MSRRNQIIALAGMAQAVYLVDRIAKTGQADEAAQRACINALFAFSADGAEQAFGGLADLSIGLRALQDLFSGPSNADRAQTLRYAMSCIYLQTIVAKDRDMTEVMRERLQHCERSRDLNKGSLGSNPSDDRQEDLDAIARGVAGVYQDTISQLRFRINVTGAASQLQNPQNAARIRALLLAAIRAVFLWRQAGGKRWQLIFFRGRLQRELDSLIAQQG